MNKKLISQVVSININTLIFLIIMMVNFMRDVKQALYAPVDMGPLNVNNVGFTIFQMKIEVTQQGLSHLYTIGNYPIIPIFVALLYNGYILFKVYRNKTDS